MMQQMYHNKLLVCLEASRHTSNQHVSHQMSQGCCLKAESRVWFIAGKHLVHLAKPASLSAKVVLSIA